MKVAVLDDWAGVASEYADWDKLDAEVICLMRERTPFPAILIDQLPKLRLLVPTGPRNLSIDVEAARRKRVVVSGTRSRKTTTSELSLVVATTKLLLTTS